MGDTRPSARQKWGFRGLALLWCALAWAVFLIWPLGLAGLVAVEVAFVLVFLSQVWRRRRFRHLIVAMALPALFITQTELWVSVGTHFGGMDTPRTVPWSNLDLESPSPFLTDSAPVDHFEAFNIDRTSRMRAHRPFCGREITRLTRASRRWGAAVSEVTRGVLSDLFGPARGAYTGPYPDRVEAYALIHSEASRQGTLSGLIQGVDTPTGCLRLHPDARRELHDQAPADLDYVVGRGHHRDPLLGDCSAPHTLDGPADRPITYALLGDEGIVVQLGLLPHESPVHLDPPLFLLDLHSSQLFALYTHP